VELGYFEVTAPASGTIGDIPVRVGDFVTPQTTLTTIDDNDLLEAYVNVPIERAGALSENTPVEILDREGKVLATTKVTFVSPRADPGTQMLLVKARIDNKNRTLRTAQLVGARVVWAQRPGLVVPVLAVQTRAGQAFVWIVRRAQTGLVADLRPVELGPLQGQNYAIRRGLEANEQIVVSGIQKLRPGAPIMPMAAGAGGPKPGG
jgi:RND family efflux transporter MFP subunit